VAARAGALAPLSAIVLAGGRSSRFGGSKLDEPFGSTTVLGSTIARVRQVADEIVVVRAATGRATGGAPTQSRQRIAGDGTPALHEVADETPFQGPLAGLRRGLEVARNDLVLAIGGDMPLVRAEVLRLLAAQLADAPAAAAACLVDGAEVRPLPLALRRDPALAIATELLSRGDRSLRALLAAVASIEVEEAGWRALDRDADTLLDVDRPADLEAARARAPRG